MPREFTDFVTADMRLRRPARGFRVHYAAFDTAAMQFIDRHITAFAVGFASAFVLLCLLS